MNRGTARTRVRLLLNERAAAQWTDAELNDFIAQANNEVFSFINAASVDYFHKHVRISYPAETFGVVLDTASDLITATPVGRWERLLAVFKLPSNAAASSSNLPVQVQTDQGIFDMWDSAGGLTRDSYHLDRDTTVAASYRINQRTLLMAPFQADVVYLWIHLIPRVAEPDTDAKHLLSIDAGTTGELEQHHDVICQLAAIDALISIRADYSHLSPRYADKRTNMVRALGLQQQSQSAPRVANAHGY